jgi:hypothetical protein
MIESGVLYIEVLRSKRAGWQRWSAKDKAYGPVEAAEWVDILSRRYPEFRFRAVPVEVDEPGKPVPE